MNTSTANTAGNQPAEIIESANAQAKVLCSTPPGQKTNPICAFDVPLVNLAKLPANCQPQNPLSKPAKSIGMTNEELSHVLLTLNSLRNVALQAQGCGGISRYTYNCLTDDISQSINMIHRLSKG